MGQGEEATKQKAHFTSCQEPGGEGKEKPHHHLSTSHGGMVALAPGAVPAGDHGSAVLFHCDAAGEGLGLALPWLPALLEGDTSTLPPQMLRDKC